MTRNHVTDAGVASIIAVQIAQSSQAASSEGAGGVRAVVMPPSVKGFGAVMTERELEAQQERFEANEAEAAAAAEAAMKAGMMRVDALGHKLFFHSLKTHLHLNNAQHCGCVWLCACVLDPCSLG